MSLVDYKKIFWGNAPEEWNSIRMGEILNRKNKRFKNYLVRII